MKNKIKVVQVIADSDIGGGPAHVLGILKHLDRDHFDPYLICPAGNLSSEAKSIPGVQVFNVTMKSKFDFSAFFEIKKRLHQIQAQNYPFAPMIAHFHGARAGFLGRFVMPRHIVNIYTEHSIDKNYHLANPINEWIQKKMTARLNQRSNLVIAVSSSVENFLLKKNLSPKGRTIVIPNGLDLETFANHITNSKRVDTVHHAPIIGSIGSLNRQKGYTYLIEAMTKVLKHFPLATLEIIGKGPEEDNLKREIRDNNLERHITLLGEKKEIQSYLKNWDVFALPSISETFGIVVLEAMKAGIPVVATKVGGIKDIIEDKESGLLVESKNPHKLADSIIDLLQHPVLASKLKRNGLNRVEDFDWKRVIKKIESAYLQTLKSYR